jgi:hypothetical protein
VRRRAPNVSDVDIGFVASGHAKLTTLEKRASFAGAGLLAYRMQGCAPDGIDVSRQSTETKKLNGLDDNVTEPFDRQSLRARRLVESGACFVPRESSR